MFFLTGFIVAIAISIAVFLLMIYFAPQLGMAGLSDLRKAHAKPIPRVGDVRIRVLG